MKAYTKKAVKVAEDMFALCESDHHPEVAHAWRDSENRQVLVNGYYAFRLEDPLPVKEGAPGMDSDKFFKPFFEKDDFGGEYVRVSCPTKLEIERYISEKRKAYKEEHGKYPDRVYYDFGENYPRVNAYYLRDVLEVLHKPLVYCLNMKRGEILPVYFSAENGDGALCPVRKEGV